MKIVLVRLAIQFIGDPKLNSLEHRLFNSVTLVNGMINLLGSFFSFYLPNFWILFGFNFGTGVIFLTMYYISRYKGIYYILYWPLNGTILLYLSFIWFYNGGSLGGSHYYLIPALVIATILLKKNNIVFVYFVYMLVSGLLFGIEFKYPNLITQFESTQDRYLDAGLNYIFIQILTGILIFILSRNLELERKKSESLLLNILPEQIADELKKNDMVIPFSYQSATVLFTDMAGFTKIAEQMTPTELIQELDEVFSCFDEIIKKHKMEKIKTIGDAYMAAAGLPMVNTTHAIDSVLCSLDFLRFMDSLQLQKRKENKLFFELRIGIHTGSVVAGVVGKDKFAYDIWGDTVNTASRMESSGIIGKVNISNQTYELVKEFFECTYRGKILAKNKGEIDMYIVNNIQKNLCDVDGKPNSNFWELYKRL